MGDVSDKLLTCDLSGAILPDGGLQRRDLAAMADRLEAVRRQMWQVGDAAVNGEPGTSEARSGSIYADHGLPERILEAYHEQPKRSVLGRILGRAHRLRDQVDRVVVLGSGPAHWGASALMEACCDPYFNELSRGERGSRPRMYFAGDDFDNDVLQGLLHLLGKGRPVRQVEDRWAIVVASPSGNNPRTAVALSHLVASLRTACGNDQALLGDLVLPVAGAESPLREMILAAGCSGELLASDAVGGSFTVLSPAALLPAAILGLNVVRLLEGAQTLNEHFRAASPGENIVLGLAGVCHLVELRRPGTARELYLGSRAIGGVGPWYRSMLALNPRRAGEGTPAVIVVTPRDLFSSTLRPRNHRSTGLVINVCVERCRSDPLAVVGELLDRPDPSGPAAATLPEWMAAAAAEAMQADREAGQPGAAIRLPESSEFWLGQLLQMLTLAAEVERRLCEL